MIMQTQIDNLENLFRLSKGMTVSSNRSHMIGRFFFLQNSKSADREHLLQFYEAIHTKRQILCDLELLRTFINVGIEAPVPLISKMGESVDLETFDKLSVLFSVGKPKNDLLNESEIFHCAKELAKLSSLYSQKPSARDFGKKIDSIFTMFELAMREQDQVEEFFKSEYFAFKASFIDLLNKEDSSSFAFFPGNDHFFLSEENHLGFSHRAFLYDMPPLYALSQFVLATCFDLDNKLDFSLLDQATSGFASATDISDQEWQKFDQVLKNAAFLEVLCLWLSMIYHPKLIHVDSLINARMRQKHLSWFVLKEAL